MNIFDNIPDYLLRVNMRDTYFKVLKRLMILYKDVEHARYDKDVIVIYNGYIIKRDITHCCRIALKQCKDNSFKLYLHDSRQDYWNPVKTAKLSKYDTVDELIQDLIPIFEEYKTYILNA